MLSHNAHDSQALWEEELKNRSRFGLRLAELEKEKGELSNQVLVTISHRFFFLYNEILLKGKKHTVN